MSNTIKFPAGCTTGVAATIQNPVLAARKYHKHLDATLCHLLQVNSSASLFGRTSYYRRSGTRKEIFEKFFHFLE